jgi:hypothetical protein
MTAKWRRAGAETPIAERGRTHRIAKGAACMGMTARIVSKLGNLSLTQPATGA